MRVGQMSKQKFHSANVSAVRGESSGGDQSCRHNAAMPHNLQYSQTEPSRRDLARKNIVKHLDNEQMAEQRRISLR